MGDPITVAAGAMMGADVIGGAVQANSAKKAQQAQYKKMNAIFEQLSPEVRGLYDRAFDMSKGYGKTSMRQAEQSAKASFDAGREDAISRGLHNTTYLDAMRRGINSDLMGAKSAINEQTATMLAQILQGKAGAISNLGLGHAQALSQYQMAPGGSPGLANWAKVFWPNGLGG
jgi:hypothetical protein